MIVTTRDQLHEVVEAYTAFDEFAFDVETKGPHRGDPRRNEVFWLSLAGPGRGDVIPMGHPLGEIVDWDVALRKDGQPRKGAKPKPIYGKPPAQLRAVEVFKALRPIFFSDRLKVGHYVKFDVESTEKYLGKTMPPPFADTGILAYLGNENHTGNKPYSLGAVTNREFGFLYDKSLGRIGVETFPFREAARYSYLDAKYTYLLKQPLLDFLRYERLIDVLELEEELLECVIDMETTGVELDTVGLHKLDAELAKQIEETEQRLYKANGGEFNLNADRQVANLLFTKRGHKPTILTPKKKEPSVAAAALEPYTRDPVVQDFLEWDGLKKTHVTYVVGILNRLHEGRLHADFDQRGTRTGRFSAREPNLTNIPTRRSKQIRDLFRAPKGFKLIVADFSQIELRILAHYCKDPVLLRAFREGLDVHAVTAAKVLNIPIEDLTSPQRDGGKTTNFLTVYGGGAGKLAKSQGITLRAAKRFLDGHRAEFPSIYKWKSAVISECKRNRVTQAQALAFGGDPQPPHVCTMLGRKRRLPGILYQDSEARSYAERQAVNSKIQGSAADIQKLAMVRHHRMTKGTDHQLVLTVHDELVVLTPEDEVDQGVAWVTEAMEGVELPVKLLVPLTVDVKVCDRWSEAKG